MPEDFFSASVSLSKLFWTFERGSTGFFEASGVLREDVSWLLKEVLQISVAI